MTSWGGLDDVIRTCPRFANNGCFKSQYTVGEVEIGGFETGFHKGCSMYPLGDISKECSTSGPIGTTCRGKSLAVTRVSF